MTRINKWSGLKTNSEKKSYFRPLIVCVDWIVRFHLDAAAAAVGGGRYIKIKCVSVCARV